MLYTAYLVLTACTEEDNRLSTTAMNTGSLNDYSPQVNSMEPFHSKPCLDISGNFTKKKTQSAIIKTF